MWDYQVGLVQLMLYRLKDKAKFISTIIDMPNPFTHSNISKFCDHNGEVRKYIYFL